MEVVGGLRIQVHDKCFALRMVSNLAVSQELICLLTCLYEIGEQIAPSPARISKHLPGIKVRFGAPGHDEPIEDGSAAHDMSYGVSYCLIIQEFLRCGGYIPVIGWIPTVADESGDGRQVTGGISVGES